MAPSAEISTAREAGGVTVQVVIRNGSPAPITLCTVTFAPSLALEVGDASGAPVPLGPPPMPPSDLSAFTTTIEGGGSLALSYPEVEIFPGGAAPGAYRVRFATNVPQVDGGWSGQITSDWVTLTLE
jgi:hypothetical protein